MPTPSTAAHHSRTFPQTRVADEPLHHLRERLPATTAADRTVGSLVQSANETPRRGPNGEAHAGETINTIKKLGWASQASGRMRSASSLFSTPAWGAYEVETSSSLSVRRGTKRSTVFGVSLFETYGIGPTTSPMAIQTIRRLRCKAIFCRGSFLVPVTDIAKYFASRDESTMMCALPFTCIPRRLSQRHRSSKASSWEIALVTSPSPLVWCQSAYSWLSVGLPPTDTLHSFADKQW
jgi:hypothetical protein